MNDEDDEDDDDDKISPRKLPEKKVLVCKGEREHRMSHGYLLQQGQICKVGDSVQVQRHEHFPKPLSFILLL